jgi:pilus assembly protein CpaB
VSVRSILIVGLALAFGVSAAVLVNATLSAGPPKMETTQVLVAAVDIPRGVVVMPAQVTTVEFPRHLTPPGAMTKKEDVLERAAITAIVKGEPLLDGKLAPKGAGRGLAALVPPGMRAFTITTPNIASGVAGFVLPGNKVDVLLTMTGDANDGTGGGSTTTLLQNLEIMAVDQRIDAPAENKMDANQLRSVTLLVTPDQAAKLDLGQNRGTLHLSLRNIEDKLAANARPATMNSLRFLQEKPWDERAKGVIEAMGKALASQKKEAPVVVNVPKSPEPPARISVRTLRGMSEGRVDVELINSPSSVR